MVHTMIINGDCIDEDDLYKVIVIYKPEWDKKYIEEFMNIYLNKIWTVTSYVGYLNDDPSRFDDIVGSEAY